VRVLFTHTYSMSEVRALVEAGRYPRQHLWGADALERVGHDVEYGPFGHNARLARLTRLTRGKFGYLDEERAIARRRPDVVYSGDQNLTRGLAYKRRAGRLDACLMSVFHSIGRRSLASSWVRGVDVALCLSARTRDLLVSEYERDVERTHAVRWGPDLAYYSPRSGGEGVISAGKTGRDVATLRAALERIGLPSRIHALEPGEAPRDLNLILDDMRAAAVVAIPLLDPDKLLGLSELNDALALGKAVVVTRSPHFDFDIEACGFGIWVEPHDVDSLAAALERASANAEEMGRRARAFAEGFWNYEIFCDDVVASIR
jgi:glycosyltransferase involved in cell wall biosynthesis